MKSIAPDGNVRYLRPMPGRLPAITTVERRRRLGMRHLLVPSERTNDVGRIARSLVALHGSDPATVFLSAGARMHDPSIDAVETALYADRTLIRHHAMRRTVWIMPPETARAAHASSGRKVAATERRAFLRRLAASEQIEDEALWLDGALAQVTAAIDDAQPIGTRELGELLPDLRIPLEYPGPRNGTTAEIIAHTKVVQLAAFEGRIVRTRPLGSWISSQYQWAPMASWLPEGIDDLDKPAAAATIIQRWLERFGPGTMQDLRWWTGWTATQTRAALDAVDATSVSLDDGTLAWVASGDTDPIEASDDKWVAILPGLDPTPMGWKDRNWYLSPDVAERTFDRNGNVGPSIWADGEMMGGWVQRDDGELALELLRDLSPDHRDLLEIERDRIKKLVGDTRFRVRFPSPNQKDLLR